MLPSVPSAFALGSHHPAQLRDTTQGLIVAFSLCLSLPPFSLPTPEAPAAVLSLGHHYG